jgi:hypothetical protein
LALPLSVKDPNLPQHFWDQGGVSVADEANVYRLREGSQPPRPFPEIIKELPHFTDTPQACKPKFSISALHFQTLERAHASNKSSPYFGDWPLT